nr:hypothetical protein [Tanacetum cinerariifolium]
MLTCRRTSQVRSHHQNSGEAGASKDMSVVNCSVPMVSVLLLLFRDEDRVAAFVLKVYNFLGAVSVCVCGERDDWIYGFALYVLEKLICVIGVEREIVGGDNNKQTQYITLRRSLSKFTLNVKQRVLNVDDYELRIFKCLHRSSSFDQIQSQVKSGDDASFLGLYHRVVSFSGHQYLPTEVIRDLFLAMKLHKLFQLAYDVHTWRTIPRLVIILEGDMCTFDHPKGEFYWFNRFSDRFSLESSGTSDTRRQTHSTIKSQKSPSKNKEPKHLRRSGRLEDQSTTGKRQEEKGSSPKERGPDIKRRVQTPNMRKVQMTLVKT